MNIVLGPTKIAGDGLIYPFKDDVGRFEVLVALNDDGIGWRVRFDIDGDQYIGNGSSPESAFRAASELTSEALASRGRALDIIAIKAALSAGHALDTSVSISLNGSELAVLGISSAYASPLDISIVERRFSEAQFMLRTQGIRSPHWHIQAAQWKDYGRELLVTVRLGF